MESQEPEGPATPPRSGEPSPEQGARAEHGTVPTSFSPQTGRRTKRVVAIAAALLATFLVIVSVSRYFHAQSVADTARRASSTPPLVNVVRARPVSAGQELVLPGETAAWFETTIYARVNGYVQQWMVDIGDRVEKGQVLVTIETPELDAELAAARAQLQASQSQVDARKAEAEFSRTTYERWRGSPKGVVSEQEREAKKADHESAMARLYAANAQVTLDRSKVDQFSALTQFKQVRAPFDGTITERKIDIGDLVTAGSASTTTPMYRMAQTDPLRVFVDVPQRAASDLMNAGVPAEIRMSGTEGPVVSGRVSRSARSINVQARTMRVEVDIPNASHAFVPGMYVNVAFTLPPRGWVQVPAAALIFRATGIQVAKVEANDTIRFADVVIARDDGRVVELSSGVRPGDRLVLNINTRIASGQKVTVNEPQAAGTPPAARR
jgi:RND family efflux transporter MFP subunit